MRTLALSITLTAAAFVALSYAGLQHRPVAAGATYALCVAAAAGLRKEWLPARRTAVRAGGTAAAR